MQRLLSARPLAINREAGNCAHLLPPPARSHRAEHFAQFSTFPKTAWRQIVHYCKAVLCAPSWSYIGHYCSPPRVRRQFSRRRPRSQKVDAAANWKMLITVGTQRKLSGTVRRLRHFSGICATQSRRCRAKNCG